MADKAIRALLDYTVNQQSVDKVVQSTLAVGKGIDDIDAALQRAYASGLSFDEAMAKIAADADAASPALQAAASDADAVTQAISAIGDQTVKVQALTADIKDMDAAIASAAANANAFPDKFIGQGDVGEGGDGSGATKGLRAVGAAARLIPGGGAVSRFARPAATLLANTDTSLAELGLAAGIAAPAIIAVVAAFGEFNKGIDASKGKLASTLSAQDKYFADLQEKTTEQAKTQLEALDRSQPILKQQIDETQRALDSAFSQAVATFGDTGARALDSAGKLPTAQLRDQLKDLTGEFDTSTDYAARLTQGLAAGVFTTNDAIEAEKELEKSRRASLDASIAAAHEQVNNATASADQLRQKQADLANTIGIDSLALNQTSDPDEIKRLNDEINQASIDLGQITNTFLPIAEHADDVVQSQQLQAASASELSGLLNKTTEDYNRLSAVISGLQATGAATPETLNFLNDALKRDGDLVTDLVTKYLPLAQAREAELSGLDSFERASTEAAKFFTANADDISKAQTQIEAEETRHSTAVQKITEDKNLKIEQIEDDSIEQSGKLAEKYGIDRKRAQEDLQKELLKLAATEKGAIGERDTLALKKAKESENEEKDQARTKAEREKQDYEREIQALAKATQKKIDLENAGAARSIQIETQKYNVEIQARQQALDIALAQYRQFVNDLKNQPGSASINGQSVSVSYNPNTNIQTQAQAAAAFAQIQRDQGIYNGTLHSHALGLERVPYDGYMALLHKNEGILTAEQNYRRLQAFSSPQSGGGSGPLINVNINLDGKTFRASSRTEAKRVFNELIETVK